MKAKSNHLEFSDPFSLVCSLVHFLNIIEPNKPHRFRDILTFKRSKISLEALKSFISKLNKIKKGKEHIRISRDSHLDRKAIRMTRKYIPSINVLDKDSFIILESQIYAKFSPLEKLLLYLYQNEADTIKNATDVPEYFVDETFKKYLGIYYDYDYTSKIYLLPRSNKIFVPLFKHIYNLIYEVRSRH